MLLCLCVELFVVGGELRIAHGSVAHWITKISVGLKEFLVATVQYINFREFQRRIDVVIAIVVAQKSLSVTKFDQFLLFASQNTHNFGARSDENSQ